ncbi:hypothetical protein [Candidatus Amarobacter glycogenicus]|uniref:hypothetical protein n=1 Tax=Candidatus Amarobacter glycogenicus TaxID=3140699 RepID=UPI002A126842|nr:hypothetical protein [Dehalococcoidia bacterium]
MADLDAESVREVVAGLPASGRGVRSVEVNPAPATPLPGPVWHQPWFIFGDPGFSLT